jgi:hypothetical protein
VKVAASGILNGWDVGTSCRDGDFLEFVWSTLVSSGSLIHTHGRVLSGSDDSLR